MDDLQRTLALLQTEPPLFYSILAIVSICIGSFVNVVIYRLPRLMIYQWQQSSGNTSVHDAPLPANLISSRSCCPHCQTQIKAIHNIPIIGFLLLGGRCAHCKHPISRRYPLVELLTLITSLHLGMSFGPSIILIFALIFLWILIALTFIDLDHQILPDNLTLGLLWLGLLANYFSLFTSLHSAVLGAMLGYLSLWTIYHLYRLATGKEGMGHGDFKLLAAIGAWLGWQYLPMVILIASITGLIFAISNILLTRSDTSIPIAFGPYLAISGWACLTFGPEILNFYLTLIGVQQ